REVLGVRQSPVGLRVPDGACDCHVHVFGPAADYPYAASRAYTPGDASMADLLALQGHLNLSRVVLIQPSSYGTDNRRLLDALGQLGPRARGVAVIDADIGHAELEAMHAAGVRGARLNLETTGERDPQAAARLMQAISARVAPLGWHLQTYISLEVLAPLHDTIIALPVPLVVDHFGRARRVDQPGFQVLLSLVRTGRAYVKLSAPRRIADPPECSSATPVAQALIAANPDRMLWGTDWPHTSTNRQPGCLDEIEAFEAEDDGMALNRLAGWVGEPALLKRILVDNPARLYDFP
ncbi:MAG TPA: amidohydrolase family protein, partial [Stellaceae bacterium]|nr:amidohydrolase family protein [Stellaceae bacterium]